MRQMKSSVLFVFLILSLALTACSSKEKQKEQEEKGTVFVIDERSQDKREAVKAENPLSGRNVFFAGYMRYSKKGCRG